MRLYLSPYEQSCLILSPDRAGKTWLFAGIAYCIKNECTGEPQFNESLKQLCWPFVDPHFDDPLLETSEGGEIEFLKFQLAQRQLIRQQQMTVKSVDYTSPDPAIPVPLEIIETKEQEA